MKPFAFGIALLLSTLTQAQTTKPVARDLPKWEKPLFGVYCGNSPDAIRKYEDWLGKPADAVLGYTGDKDWKDYDGSVGWAIGLWRPMDKTVLWSVPLIPRTGTLAEAAAGKYNERYTKAAKQLAEWRPEEPVLYIRTAWEFNGGWMHYKAVGQPQNFIGAWKQFVDCFRAESDRFRFDWCPAGCDKMPMNAEDAYPGDDYVDLIGLDVYDQLRWKKIKDPKQRWKEIYVDGPNGLAWHRDFAKKHKKPIAFSEWGAGGNEAGENTFFIEQMHRWMLDNKVVYANYWNSNANYKGLLSDGTYPKTGERYRDLFGKKE